MPDKNHYEILELSRSANQEQIDEQFRLMLYKYHPDHNPGNEDWASDQTIALLEAYKVLSDPAARAKYDFKLMFKLREKRKSGGLSLFKKKETMAAEKLFEEALALWGQGKGVPAAETFKKALIADPTYEDAAFNFSLLAAWLGNPSVGMELLNRVVKGGSKDPELLKLRNALNKAFMGM
jgi:DnaJ-class molecular chaperone